MKRVLAAVVLATGALALPSAAGAAGPITALCNAGGCSTGWYTSDVVVTFMVSGTVVSGCTPVTINADQNVPPQLQQPHCEVTDGQNQTTTTYVPIKRDATPPTASLPTPQRAPDTNGWYNRAVGVAATGTDNLSGIASCTSVTYSGPDASAASVSGTCTDNAGNVSAPKTISFQYDATPPSVSPAPARGPDANGWYNHAVNVVFQGADPVSGIDSCTSGSYSGPDSGSASVPGTCRDKAGNTGTASFGLNYDASPPAVAAATPDRQPDSNGWYNHGITVVYSGADATSGIDSCDAPAYDKPDDPSAAVNGRCRDKAGNVSAPTPFTFKFDSTPPKLAKLALVAQSGAVALTWTASADVAAVKITRTRGTAAPATLYNGKRISAFTDKKVQNGTHYTYAVIALDEAGNETTGKGTGDPSAPLLAPRHAALVHGGTTLRWKAAPRATYYNVQLWLRGRKVLTQWPAGPSLRLSHLHPGAYAWLVWPGLGARSKHEYGPLIGRSTFVVKG